MISSLRPKTTRPMLFLLHRILGGRLFDKLLHREVDQFRSILESAVPRSRQEKELAVRQTSKYFRGFFDGRQVMIARYDHHRGLDSFQIVSIDYNRLCP